MANTLESLAPRLLAQGVMALRQNSIMPRLVNSSYSAEAAKQGSTVDIPIPSAIAVQAVTPSNTPPSTTDIAPTHVPITLDEWHEAPFYLDDNDKKSIVAGSLPMQASEAVKAVANKVDTDLLSLYKGFYGAVGTAGSDPFSSISDAADLRALLNTQLAPNDPRYAVLDAVADAKATELRAFNDTSYSGDNQVIKNGFLGRKLGFEFGMNQNVPRHTAGGANGSYLTASAGLVIGSTAIPVDTGTGTFVEGDIITFASHNQQYVVTADSAGGSVTLTVQPPLVASVPDNNAITLVASHTANLAFHRDAIGFATRQLLDPDAKQLGSIIQSAIDPISGLTLRLEITREHKRTRYSYDILYGYGIVRRELGVRLLGA